MIGAAFVILSGARTYLDVCALLSAIAVGYACWRQKLRIGALSAATMIFGLLCFAAKVSPFNTLQPADILHLALAAGWLGLNGRVISVGSRID